MCRHRRHQCLLHRLHCHLCFHHLQKCHIRVHQCQLLLLVLVLLQVMLQELLEERKTRKLVKQKKKKVFRKYACKRRNKRSFSNQIYLNFLCMPTNAAVHQSSRPVHEPSRSPPSSCSLSSSPSSSVPSSPPLLSSGSCSAHAQVSVIAYFTHTRCFVYLCTNHTTQCCHCDYCYLAS